ncbi:hypothetical protein Fcan01_23337 [Folsomia candida]|uniref:Uncharacterized protein n=1 Tax=Folsomia candida TaxID=158441 RepID=A0A226D8H6_FOLCA|nr:hypothetical protein Fcan01_23337 [Folsomia candida]
MKTHNLAVLIFLVGINFSVRAYRILKISWGWPEHEVDHHHHHDDHHDDHDDHHHHHHLPLDITTIITTIKVTTTTTIIRGHIIITIPKGTTTTTTPRHNLYKHTIHKHNQHKHILNIVKAPEQIVHSYNQEVVKVVPTEERSSRRSPSTTSSTKFLPRRNKQPHRLSTMDTSIRIMTGRYKPPWLEGVGPRGGRVCGVEQLNM